LSRKGQRRDRGAPKRAPQTRTARSAPAFALLGSLAAILALQLALCAGRFQAPFLDTRLHYDHDNALFTFYARNGLRNGDWRSQSGVTVNAYARWGERVGIPAYYTHHPFLGMTLFQQYARLAGTGENASRSFALIVSFGIAAGALVIFRDAIGRTLPALAGAATLVSLPLFALYQTTLKFETQGMLAGVWLYAALSAYPRRPSRGRLALIGALAAASVLVHWTSALFLAAVAAYLLGRAWRSREPSAWKACGAAVAGGLAGAVLLFFAMSALQGGAAVAWDVLRRQLSVRSAPVAAGEWWARQALYARMNFGPLVAWLLGGLGVSLLVLWWRSGKDDPEAAARMPVRRLAPFFWTTLVVGVVWVVALRQGSFVHVYWQYWLCLPLAALVAMLCAMVPPRPLPRAIGTLAFGGLLAAWLVAANGSYRSMVADRLGVPEDIAFLKTLREERFPRLVFVPLSEAPWNAWFHGPLFEYYTDRPVVAAARPEDLRAGDKVLVLRYQQREEIARRLGGWSGRSLSGEACGERLCAYDVR
jgi:hypothetical protein